MSGALIAAMGAVHDFAGGQGLSIAAAQRLAIIVEEIVSNLLEHAGHGRDIAFRLVFDRDESGTQVTLEDDSDAFDPRTAPEPEGPNPIRGGGVGLTLVTAWAQILSYDSADGWNRLILRQRPVER